MINYHIRYLQQFLISSDNTWNIDQVSLYQDFLQILLNPDKKGMEYRVHVHSKQGPEDLTVLDQEVAEPRERLFEGDSVKIDNLRQFFMGFNGN